MSFSFLNVADPRGIAAGWHSRDGQGTQAWPRDVPHRCWLARNDNCRTVGLFHGDRDRVSCGCVIRGVSWGECDGQRLRTGAEHGARDG
jgi:hypothetical protein